MKSINNYRPFRESMCELSLTNIVMLSTPSTRCELLSKQLVLSSNDSSCCEATPLNPQTCKRWTALRGHCAGIKGVGVGQHNFYGCSCESIK